MPALTASASSELFRRPPDSLLDVGGGAGEAAYWRVGSGPDVLLVHGWPVSGATFRTLLPHLADHVTCHVIDFPGAGSSRFSASTSISVEQHIRSLRRIVDLLGLESVAVVGHDSGGLIARHAMAGDSRLRAMGLIDTEQTHRLSWRFRSFLLARHLPGFGAIFGWSVGQRRLRRLPGLLGGCFADPTLLDGEFDEFFLRPIHTDPARRRASVQLLDTFDVAHIKQLPAIHQQIDVPVTLVWGERDPFFPVAWAREMVPTFANATLSVIAGTGLFSHEEQPESVAQALLPVLTGAVPAMAR
jgi:haloalkane dehalogenase